MAALPTSSGRSNWELLLLAARRQAPRITHRVEAREVLCMAPGPAATAGFGRPGRQHWKMLVVAPEVVVVLAAALDHFLAEWALVVPCPLGMHTVLLANYTEVADDRVLEGSA